jgi:hypothetical protein
VAHIYNSSKASAAFDVYNPSYLGGHQKDQDLRPYREKMLHFISTKKLEEGGVAQVVECLPSKCEGLSSSSSIKKQKQKPGPGGMPVLSKSKDTGGIRRRITVHSRLGDG